MDKRNRETTEPVNAMKEDDIENASAVSAIPEAVTQDGNQQDQAEALYQEGITLYSQGEYHKSLEKFQASLTLCQDSCDQGVILNNIGLVYRVLGKYQQSLSCYHKALAIIKTLDEKALKGTVFNSIGTVLFHQGQLAQALDYLQQALNEANLQDVDLSRAKLVQTQLDATDFTGATLTGAYIEAI